MECKLTPFPGRCIVQREQFVYHGNLTIPDVAKRAPTLGHVVAVGDKDHEYLLGRRVIFSRLSGSPMYIQGWPKFDLFMYEELQAMVETDEELVPDMEDGSLLSS